MKTASTKKANRRPRIIKYGDRTVGVTSTRGGNAKYIRRWYDGLTVRASNALQHMGLTNREDIHAAMKRGDIHPSNVKALNIGWKTYREIRTWLGMPMPMSDQKIHHWRARFANLLFREGVRYDTIAKILHLRSKEHARQHVAKGANVSGLKFISGRKFRISRYGGLEV